MAVHNIELEFFFGVLNLMRYYPNFNASNKWRSCSRFSSRGVWDPCRNTSNVWEKCMVSRRWCHFWSPSDWQWCRDEMTYQEPPLIDFQCYIQLLGYVITCPFIKNKEILAKWSTREHRLLKLNDCRISIQTHGHQLLSSTWSCCWVWQCSRMGSRY